MLGYIGSIEKYLVTWDHKEIKPQTLQKHETLGRSLPFASNSLQVEVPSPCHSQSWSLFSHFSKLKSPQKNS